MNNEELLREIELQRALMIAVATGGERIETVNSDYSARRSTIRTELSARGLSDPNPFADLWSWYGKWHGGDLPTYQSRRVFISELYQPLIDQIHDRAVRGARVFAEPTGWAKVDRDLDEMRQRLERAQNETQFQSVGHLCREIIITLAQGVFDPNRHQLPDVMQISPTDAKRMLEAYISTELAGSSHEALRRHAKAALDVSNDLQHRRTARFREAALCAEATSSVVNLLAIIDGRRDPE